MIPLSITLIGSWRGFQGRDIFRRWLFLSLVELTWATSRATAAWLPQRSPFTSRLSVSVSGTPLNRDGHVERDVRHPLSTAI